jgi:hypothetical protein
MSGSGASNLGYGNMSPFYKSAFINSDNSHSPATFSTNEIPGLPGLAGAKNNVDAAAGLVPGICNNYKGGAKFLKKKIKNITKKYKKMKSRSHKLKSFKKKLKHRIISRGLAKSFAGGKKTRHHKKHTHKRRQTQRGGYSQYQNNQPFSLSYSVGGILPASELGLANPPPISSQNLAIDNYSKYTNGGFPSRGH